MRKVFVFWGIIFVILMLGAAAIVYGKILLKEEIERAERIREELAVSIATTHLEVESFIAPQDSQLPEFPGVTANRMGPLVPYTHRIPSMPRLLKPATKRR